MSSSRLLQEEQLETLRTLWVAQGAPIAQRLRAPLSDAEIDKVTESIGVSLPSEARTWWGWHDGAESDEAVGAELGPDLRFMSLSEAVDQYRFWRGLFEEEWKGLTDDFYDDPDYWWRPSWLPVTERSGAIRIETAVNPGQPSPVYWAYFADHDAQGLARPRVSSMGEMVDWWIEALEAGSWAFDPGKQRWMEQPERMPPHRRSSGLI